MELEGEHILLSDVTGNTEGSGDLAKAGITGFHNICRRDSRVAHKAQARSPGC